MGLLLCAPLQKKFLLSKKLNITFYFLLPQVTQKIKVSARIFLGIKRSQVIKRECTGKSSKRENSWPQTKT